MARAHLPTSADTSLYISKTIHTSIERNVKLYSYASSFSLTNLHKLFIQFLLLLQHPFLLSKISSQCRYMKELNQCSRRIPINPLYKLELSEAQLYSAGKVGCEHPVAENRVSCSHAPILHSTLSCSQFGRCLSSHHPRSKESKLLLQLLSNDPTGKAIGGWGMQYGQGRRSIFLSGRSRDLSIIITSWISSFPLHHGSQRKCVSQCREVLSLSNIIQVI